MNTLRLCQVTTVALMVSSQSFAQTFELPLPPASDLERSMALEALSPTGSEVPEEIQEYLFLRSLESLCGANDMVDVELYTGTLGATEEFVRNHQSSTGQIQWNNDLAGKYGAGAGNVSGMRWCTGTMIADDLFLTAGHCFDKVNRPFGWVTPFREDRQIEPGEIALNMHVNFNYQLDGQTHTLREEDEFPIQELVEHREGKLDYAIARLGNNSGGELPGVKYGKKLIAPVAPQNGELVTVLQHPAGEPKKIEAGTQTIFGDVDVRYGDLDTLGGSSGSGVLNTEGHIVAVHTNGGCGPTSGQNLALSVRRIAVHSDIVK